jgi:tripartite ATP-independent transporter DctP family solute receptor
MNLCFCVISAIVMMVALIAPGVPAKVELRMGHVVAATEPTHEAALMWAKNVEERTNGDVVIKVFPSAQLGKNRDVYEQARMGAPVVGQIDPGYAAEYGSPNLSAIMGPFILANIQEHDNLVNSSLVGEWNEVLRKNSGLRILTWNWYFGPRHLISDRGFPTPDKLANVKFRCPPNPVWVETFKALGATPVTIAWAEVYTALSQGVVEGAECPLSTMIGSKLYEVKKEVTLAGHFHAISGLVMSDEVFSALTHEQQKILVEEAVKAGEWMTRVTVDKQAEYKKTLEGFGVKFTEADKPAYAAKSKPFYSESSLAKEWPKDIFEMIQEAKK